MQQNSNPDIILILLARIRNLRTQDSSNYNNIRTELTSSANSKSPSNFRFLFASTAAARKPNSTIIQRIFICELQ